MFQGMPPMGSYPALMHGAFNPFMQTAMMPGIPMHG